MSLLHWKKADKKFTEHTVEERICIAIGVIAFFFLSILIVYAFYYGLKEFVFYDESKSYVRESGIITGIIFLLPFTSLMTIGALQKLLNFKNEDTLRLMVKVMLYCIPLCFSLIIVSNFIIEFNLKNKGYSFCYWYTSPSFRGPDVWLKNDELCLQDGSVIISDIDDWFEVHNEQGTEPTLNELEAFIKKTRMELGR
ncbi:hypothetical protein [Pseudoalteromonas mariniglutinosa]|uniref:hypothetical protein n=1 Tax=Pseudoalteromonas mariniglutinosa TaxID=206042 RepID=UPI003850C805